VRTATGRLKAAATRKGGYRKENHTVNPTMNREKMLAFS
jgi:hypothetical protein